jgi:hypothetical protein
MTELILLARHYAKGVVAFVVAVVAGGIAQGLIVGATAAWITIVIGAATTAGVIAKANTPHHPRDLHARPDGIGPDGELLDDSGMSDVATLIVATLAFIVGFICAKNGIFV